MFTNTPQQLIEKKLLLLYILDKSKQSLTNAEITHFVLEHNMLDYFILQQFLSELKESDFISDEIRNHTEFLTITQKGRDALNYFINHIRNSTKDEIDKLIIEKQAPDRKKIKVEANYIQLEENLYKLSLTIIEGDAPNMELQFNVDSLEKAQNIYEIWLENAVDISKGIRDFFD